MKFWLKPPGRRKLPTLMAVIALAVSVGMPGMVSADDDDRSEGGRRGNPQNIIFFVGDGMGVSTVSATRTYSVGTDGNLILDQLPFTALSRVATTDHITPDSAGTMTSMMTGVNTNSGIVGFGPDTERNDFNGDGDGPKPWTILEQAEQLGMATGVVSTARATHATPAATYAHVNERNKENEIAAQALPGGPEYNDRLGEGIDLLWGGGRRHFCPSGATDEEGGPCSRDDGQDLRAEFQSAGYSYVHDRAGFLDLDATDLPTLGLFENSHMEYEFDRPGDLGGEPSLTEMTVKAIELLEEASGNGRGNGYFLMVESGRIDHAHHEGNAFRALSETEELDKAIGEAIKTADLRDTTIIVTADHSHVFNIAGYPLRPLDELPYTPASTVPDYDDNSDSGNHDGILDVVFDINASTGDVFTAGDSNGVPYTVLGYLNGPGHRGGPRVDPHVDPHDGRSGAASNGPEHSEYQQEAAVPLGSETHSAEEVAIYAIGRHAYRFQGTVKNSFIAEVMRQALKLKDPNATLGAPN